MEYVKICMHPRSPFSNLFTADQIWGQMVWAVSAMQGEKEAETFVDEFSDAPPFLVSMMLPKGVLPIPMVKPVKPEGNDELDAQARKLLKHNKKCKWLTFEQFKAFQTDPKLLSKIELQDSFSFSSITETHVAINRLTNAPLKGQLYNANYFSSKGSEFVIYLSFLRDEESWKNRIIEIVSYLSRIGLGGDKAVGRGIFEMELKELTKEEQEVFSVHSNRFMTLSRCSGSNLVAMEYRVSLYTGIVGGSLSGNEGKGLFNKYPVLFFEPGSVFTSGTGCLLSDVHPDTRIKTYGYAFPVPLEYKKD